MTMTKSERRQVIAMLRETEDEGETERLGIIAATLARLVIERDTMQDHGHPGCVACYSRLSTIAEDISTYRWILARGNA